jgi:hypothetical protein
MNFVEKALEYDEIKVMRRLLFKTRQVVAKPKSTIKNIRKTHTFASIKMPIDIFIGKSSVQTNIYVFKVNEKHIKKTTGKIY